MTVENKTEVTQRIAQVCDEADTVAAAGRRLFESSQLLATEAETCTQDVRHYRSIIGKNFDRLLQDEEPKAKASARK